MHDDPLDKTDPSGLCDAPACMARVDARVQEIPQTDPAFAAKADTVMAVATGVVAAGVGAVAVAGAATAAAGLHVKWKRLATLKFGTNS